MKTMTWKTKLIIAAIVIALVLAGCGIVSAMSFGSLLLALVSLAVGVGCGWYAKHIYDKYFKGK
nr:MAG TPA: GRB2-binding adapter (GAPT) [Caudoviricetes sp.]